MSVSERCCRSLETHINDGPACGCTGNSMLASLALFMEIGNMLETILAISTARASVLRSAIAHLCRSFLTDGAFAAGTATGASSSAHSCSSCSGSGS